MKITDEEKTLLADPKDKRPRKLFHCPECGTGQVRIWPDENGPNWCNHCGAGMNYVPLPPRPSFLTWLRRRWFGLVVFALASALTIHSIYLFWFKK